MVKFDRLNKNRKKWDLYMNKWDQQRLINYKEMRSKYEK